MAGLPNIRDTWDFGDPLESERRFRSILDGDGLDLDEHLQVKTQIARARGLQSKFAEAHALLDEVEASLTERTGAARLRFLLERGRALNSAGCSDEARPLFLEAWGIGRSLPNHDLAVDAAHMMAIVEQGAGAKAWNERAVEYAEASGDEGAMRWLGSLYNNMGWDAHDAGDYEGALRLHERCWEWHRERQTGWGQRVAKWSVAKQLRFLGRTGEALTMQRELLEEYLAEEPGGEGFVHEELAELMYGSGDVDGARPHFARAHEMLTEYDWVEADRLARLRELSRR